jgi:outer membrane protein
VKVILGMAVLVATTSPAWADLKIGVVQYSRLMQESPQAKAAQDALRNEFAGKQKDLQSQQAALKSREDSLQRDSATMSGDQRAQAEKELREGNRALSLKVNEYQDDFNARQNEELSKLQKVLVADGVIFASPTLDITPQILSALQARGARAPATTPSTPPAGASKTPSGK